MGLTSLACLNRSGTYSYWDDNWSSNKLYRRYYYSTFFLKILITEILNGLFFNAIYINKVNTIGYISKYKLINSYLYKNILFGKVWFLKYQNWFVVIVYYYNLNLLKKKIIKKQKLLKKKKYKLP